MGNVPARVITVEPIKKKNKRDDVVELISAVEGVSLTPGHFQSDVKAKEEDDVVDANYLRLLAKQEPSEDIFGESLRILEHQCFALMRLKAKEGKLGCDYTVEPILAGQPTLIYDQGRYTEALRSVMEGRGVRARIEDPVNSPYTISLSWETD